MNNIILVKAEMRSGSQQVVDHFVNYGYERGTTKKFYLDDDKKIVIHDHTIDYFPDKLNCTSIFLIMRKDILAQALSQLVALQVKHSLNKAQIKKLYSVHYPLTYIPIRPFSIDLYRLDKKINKIAENNKKRIELLNEKGLSYKTLYFEDFIQNPESLDKFTRGLPKKRTLKRKQQTPYQAKNLVTNYDEIIERWKNNS